MRKQLIMPTNLYEDAAGRLLELKKRRNSIEKRILKYPPGQIHIVRHRYGPMYYLRTNPKDKSGVYIHKSEEKMIRSYLQKKYDEDALKLLNAEIYNLERLIRKSFVKEISLSEKLKQLFSKFPTEIQYMINPVDISDQMYASEWMSEKFEKSTMAFTGPVYDTDRGERVRSKSELTIANTLYRLGIPYRYECAFCMKGGRVVYPDFTVMNVRKRIIIYWEHRGMMDDHDYSRNAVLKNKEYMRSGLILGDNLIITEETSANPLGTDEIDIIIKAYLL